MENHERMSVCVPVRVFVPVRVCVLDSLVELAWLGVS